MSRLPTVGSRRSRALTWMLVVMMCLVVVTFVSAYVMGRTLTRALSRELDSIVTNAMPNVVRLSTAHRDVHRLATDVDALVEVASNCTAAPRDRLARDRREINDAVIRGLALTVISGKRDPYEEVPSKLAALDACVSNASDAAADCDAGRAREASACTRRAAEDVDEALEQLIMLNAVYTQASARSIAATRDRARAVVFTMDAVAALLALAATVLGVVALRRSLGSLEEQTLELDRFAGRVAHDVLSPIQAATIALDLLGRRNQGEPSTMTLVNRGMNGLRRVSVTVQDLLAFARAGGRPETSATSDLKSVLEEVVDGTRQDATEANVQLSVEAGEPCRVACSEGVLFSLVANLTRNAIVHMGDSPTRRVQVRVVARKDRRRVEVEDTGPGVPRSLRTSMFEPFVRGDPHSPGAGLGLATVRRLSEAHHGKVGFESEVGRGSVFWVEIPVAK